MMSKLRTFILGTLLTWPMIVFSAPPIWDANFGADTGLQADDGYIAQTLGFMFPFDGVDYDTIAINSNGGVMLGVAGGFAGDPFLDYDIWNAIYFESDFTNVGNPAIVPFVTDLDNGDGLVGTIHFKTDATTAVVTWSGMATNQNSASAFITFQLTLASDGTISFGYDGITGDMLLDLDEGIVVGVSNGAGDPPPVGSNLGAAMNADLATSTVYEIWCYDENMVVAGACYDQTGTRPDNYGFDLDQTNVIFTPNGTGGFDVSALGTPVLPTTPTTPPPTTPPPTTPVSDAGALGGCTVGVADGTVDPTLPLLALMSLGYLLLRRKREV